jgi:sialate O-acetylesterase
VLKFKHIADKLVTRNNNLRGFVIAGSDKKFYWAKAEINGDTVIVSSDMIEKPVAVRYGWADNPVCTLYNKDGLPASPFRTDNWSRKDIIRNR